MATLSVGANQQYHTIAAAVAAAHDGDTVSVAAGVYTNDFAKITSKISLVAAGGTVTMLDTAIMASGQGLLTVAADATVTGFVFQGAHAADGTAAGIVYQAGNLVLQNSLVVGDQNGLVAGAAANGTIQVTGSEFSGNGNNDGVSGNIAVGAVKSLTVTNSYVHDAAGGDEIRSLAASTTVTGSRIEDNAAASLYALDLPNGGTATVSNSTIEKGARSSQAVAIQFGGGTLYVGSSIHVTGDVVLADRSGATMLRNQVQQAATVSNNTVYGFALQVSGIAVSSSNNVPTSRPTVSTAALIVPSVPVSSPVEYGRAGAVVADGTVLTVGSGKAFATLAAAVAAAHDGDTIDVSAGLYVNDSVLIGKKLTIEGVGGIAQFVDTAAPAGGAQFVTTTDLTLRNVEVFGAKGSGGTVAAGVHAEGGNLTIVNSTIHDNQAGVVVDSGVGAVGIYDTEIADNGTANGTGSNLQVAAAGTLTLRNDLVSGAVAGPEIGSAAANTVVDGVRVVQAAADAAAAVVVLPDGGNATIGNSAIEKTGAGAGALVQVGGGTVYAGSSISVSGTTLIADAATAGSVFVANASAAAALAVAGSTFVGGVAGSVQVQGGTDTGAVTATSGTVNTASPWGAGGAPAAAPLLTPVAPVGVAQNGQLILRISETAWRGDAQFTLQVDGAAVAGTLTATASHAAGLSQAFTVAGVYAPGPHVVSVTFVNSLSGAGGSRALFVDGMAFNGVDAGVSAILPGNGTALVATAPTTRSTAVTVNVSEDAWHGDALAFISIDGKVQGGVDTVMASHGAGATQAMAFVLNLAPGAHTAAVTMLNGASGAGGSRDLYVDSIDVAGAHYASAAAALGTGGTSNFAFTVAPAPAANGSLFVTAGLPTALANLVPVS